MYVCMYVCMYVYIYIYVCVCVFVVMYKYIRFLSPEESTDQDLEDNFTSRAPRPVLHLLRRSADGQKVQALVVSA